VTEEKMRQLKDLNMEIKDLQERIYNMKGAMLCDTVKGSSPRKPYAVHTIKITGTRNKDREKQNLEIIWRKKLKILQLVKMQIEEYILTIPDSKTRQVLSHKYIDNLTYKQIAEHMGISVSTVKRIYYEWRKNELD
jgi:RNA polymerase sigma factor (sigma-70 family)